MAVLGDGVFKEGVKVNEATGVDRDTIGLVSLKEEEIRTQTDTGRRQPSTRPGERLQEEPALPTPGSQTSSLQDGEK